MELQYRSKDGRLIAKFTGTSQKDVFREIATFQEIFEAESSCGCCRSTDIRFKIRDTKNNAGKPIAYYELHCMNIECRARFSFGQLTGGAEALFPKRRNEDTKEWLPNRGWHKYVPKDEQ